jgi:C4-dicarboxylate transporter, DctQ subunit
VSDHTRPGGGGAAPEAKDKQEFFVLRWIDRISEATGYLSGLCILAATLVICYAVVLRATGRSTIWQTELAVYLLIFVTFVGGAYGLKHGSHVNVDLFSNRLSVRGQLIIQVVRAVLSLVLIAVVAWYSVKMWWEATSLGWTSGTAWDPSLTYVYAILPVGMILIALQYLVMITRAVAELTRREDHRTKQVQP